MSNESLLPWILLFLLLFLRLVFVEGDELNLENSGNENDFHWALSNSLNSKNNQTGCLQKLGLPSFLGERNVTRRYKSGQAIDIEVNLTMSSGGSFQFDLCRNPSNSSGECFSRHTLLISNTNNETYKLYQKDKLVHLQYQLPPNLTCTHCLLQLKYVSEKNESLETDTDHTEEIVACADIAIDKDLHDDESILNNGAFNSVEGKPTEISNIAMAYDTISVTDDVISVTDDIIAVTIANHIVVTDDSIGVTDYSIIEAADAVTVTTDSMHTTGLPLTENNNSETHTFVVKNSEAIDEEATVKPIEFSESSIQINPVKTIAKQVSVAYNLTRHIDNKEKVDNEPGVNEPDGDYEITRNKSTVKSQSETVSTGSNVTNQVVGQTTDQIYQLANTTTTSVTTATASFSVSSSSTTSTSSPLQSTSSPSLSTTSLSTASISPTTFGAPDLVSVSTGKVSYIEDLEISVATQSVTTAVTLEKSSVGVTSTTRSTTTITSTSTSTTRSTTTVTSTSTSASTTFSTSTTLSSTTTSISTTIRSTSKTTVKHTTTKNTIKQDTSPTVSMISTTVTVIAPPTSSPKSINVPATDFNNEFHSVMIKNKNYVVTKEISTNQDSSDLATNHTVIYQVFSRGPSLGYGLFLSVPVAFVFFLGLFLLYLKRSTELSQSQKPPVYNRTLPGNDTMYHSVPKDDMELGEEDMTQLTIVTSSSTLCKSEHNHAPTMSPEYAFIPDVVPSSGRGSRRGRLDDSTDESGYPGNSMPNLNQGINQAAPEVAHLEVPGVQYSSLNYLNSAENSPQPAGADLCTKRWQSDELETDRKSHELSVEGWTSHLRWKSEDWEKDQSFIALLAQRLEHVDSKAEVTEL